MTVHAFRPEPGAEPIPGYRLGQLLGRGGNRGLVRPNRKSTRLNLQSRQYLVCRLLLEKKKALFWWRGRRMCEPAERFQFRFRIPILALCLLCAYFAYLWELRDPARLISLVSCIRRGS